LAWETFKSIGLFPETSFSVIRKKTQHKKAIRQLLKDYTDSNDDGTRKRRYSFFIKNIVSLSLFSIVFIFTNNPYFYFGYPILLVFIELFLLRVNMYGNSDYIPPKIKTDYKFSGLQKLLTTELTVHFLFERYNVNKTNIKRYLKTFIKLPYEHEIYEIVNEQKSLKDICFQIYNSGYESSDFIKHLFYVAAADKIFSEGEDTYIKKVAQYLKIENEEVKRIRDIFLARSIKEQKTKQKKYKKSSSYSSVYTFYSSKAYKILGIEKTATADEIKKAYRTLAKKHHPDKFATKGEKAMEEAEDKFQIINEAYELIKRLRNIN